MSSYSEEISQKIDEIWDSIQLSPEIIELKQSIQDAKRKAITLGVPLEVHEMLTSLISGINGGAMNSDLDAPADILYNQENWTTETVNQAGSIFQVYIGAEFSKVQLQSRQIELPIVLVVMNQKEAEELASAQACRFSPEQLQVDSQAIEEITGAENWQQRYSGAASQWRPVVDPSYESMTIKQLVEQALQDLQTQEQYEGILSPRFVDIHEVNYPENRSLLRKLRSEGCIVIMDSISIRHPVIQQALQLSLIDSSPRTSIITIAKEDLLNTLLNMSVVLELCISQIEAYRRRSDRFGEDHEFVRVSCQESDNHWQFEFVKKLRNRLRTLYPSSKDMTALFFNDANSLFEKNT